MAALACSCSSQKSIEADRYRKLNSMLHNPATRFVDLRSYSDSVAASTSDPDLRLVAEYASVSADAALLMNYGSVGQADKASYLVEFGRVMFAFISKQQQYSEVFNRGMAFDEDLVDAAESRCNAKYL
jgi:hypothetical protein